MYQEEGHSRAGKLGSESKAPGKIILNIKWLKKKAAAHGACLFSCSLQEYKNRYEINEWGLSPSSDLLTALRE